MFFFYTSRPAVNHHPCFLPQTMTLLSVNNILLVLSSLSSRRPLRLLPSFFVLLAASKARDLIPQERVKRCFTLSHIGTHAHAHTRSVLRERKELFSDKRQRSHALRRREGMRERGRNWRTSVRTSFPFVPNLSFSSLVLPLAS